MLGAEPRLRRGLRWARRRIFLIALTLKTGLYRFWGAFFLK